MFVLRSFECLGSMFFKFLLLLLLWFGVFNDVCFFDFVLSNVFFFFNVFLLFSSFHVQFFEVYLNPTKKDKYIILPWEFHFCKVQTTFFSIGFEVEDTLCSTGFNDTKSFASPTHRGLQLEDYSLLRGRWLRTRAFWGLRRGPKSLAWFCWSLCKMAVSLRYLFGVGYHPTTVFLKGFLVFTGVPGFYPLPDVLLRFVKHGLSCISWFEGFSKSRVFSFSKKHPQEFL